MTPNRFDRDRGELGWRPAMGLWLENRDSAPRIIGWTDPIRVSEEQRKQERDHPVNGKCGLCGHDGPLDEHCDQPRCADVLACLDRRSKPRGRCLR